MKRLPVMICLCLGLLAGGCSEDDGDDGNRAPSASDQQLTTEPATALSATLSASDPEGGTLTVTIVTQPEHGTIRINNGLDITYEPKLSFMGTDTFEYRVTDSAGASATATVTITVTSTGVELPDLSVTQLSITGSTSTSLDIQWEESNLNSSAGLDAGFHAVSFFLSSNQTYDEDDDVLLDVSIVTNLAANSTTGLQTRTIDFKAADGTWYLLAVSDEENDIGESDETNNIRTASFTVSGASVADLTVTQLDVVSQTDEYLTLTYAEENAGNGLAGAHGLSLYLSTDQTLDQDEDLELAGHYVPELAAGATRTWSDQVFGLTWSGIPAGTYYLFAEADSWDGIAEANEANNIMMASQTVVIDEAIVPDVEVTEVVVAGVSGNQVSLSLRVRNNDLGRAGDGVNGVKVRLVASTDDVYDEDTDVELTVVDLGSINAFNSTYVTEYVDVDLSDGTYTVIAVVDPDNEILESNETNNILAHVDGLVLNRELPDLVCHVGAVSLTASTLNVNWTARNLGSVQAAANDLTVFLSTDMVLGVGDIALTPTINVPVLSGGAAASGQNVSLDISAVADGDYYVLAAVDSGTVVTEVSEANNVHIPDDEDDTLPIRSAPDLVAEFIGVSHVDADSITCVYGVFNESLVAPSVDVPIAIVASTDTTFDTSDTVLETVNVTFGALDYHIDWELTITTAWQSLGDGTWYIGLIADYGAGVGAVDEGSYENNNTTGEDNNPARIRASNPDLQIANIWLADWTSNTVSVGLVEANPNLADAAAHTIAFYLTDDPAGDPQQTKIGDLDVAGMSGGDSRYIYWTSGDISATMAGLADGNYWVAAKVDWDASAVDGVVTESNESNNVAGDTETTRYLVANAKPDLTSDGAFITGWGNGSVDLVWALRNRTIQDAGANTVRIYASADNIWDNDTSVDPVVHSINLSSVPAGTQELRTDTITIPDWSQLPANASTSNTAFFVRLDADTTVDEYDETNNVVFAGVVHNPAGPDIVPNQFDVAHFDGDNLAVAWSEVNMSTTPVGTHVVAFVLVQGGTTTKIKEVTVSSLDAGATHAATTLIDVSGVPTGSYQLRISLDHNTDITGENSSNNQQLWNGGASLNIP